MNTNEERISGKISGSAELIVELKTILSIYTGELKDWRLGKGKGNFLLDSDMFDLVIKLLDKSDKIKKLDAVDEQGAGEEEKQQPKVRNLQDWALTKNK